MALIQCSFASEVLGLQTSMRVILPQPGGDRPRLDGPPAVLYLLHGLTGDDTDWTRNTNIERYAEALGLAVVMPQAHRSFYTNEKIGLRYFTFLSEELPAVVHTFFAVSTARSDTYVAGLSMGGYGAIKWALRQPDRFAAAASLSGALDIVSVARSRLGNPMDPRGAERLFNGADKTGSDADVYALLRKNVAEQVELPAFYVACGTSDELLPASRRFEKECAELGVPLTTDFGPGDHDWAYWDAKIQDVLAWLPLRRSGTQPIPLLGALGQASRGWAR